jgi:hypothetical protein
MGDEYPEEYTHKTLKYNSSRKGYKPDVSSQNVKQKIKLISAIQS